MYIPEDLVNILLALRAHVPTSESHGLYAQVQRVSMVNPGAGRGITCTRNSWSESEQSGSPIRVGSYF